MLEITQTCDGCRIVRLLHSKQEEEFGGWAFIPTAAASSTKNVLCPKCLIIVNRWISTGSLQDSEQKDTEQEVATPDNIDYNEVAYSREDPIRRYLSLVLRKAGRQWNNLHDGDYWPSELADALADAVLASDFPEMILKDAEIDRGKTIIRNFDHKE